MWTSDLLWCNFYFSSTLCVFISSPCNYVYIQCMTLNLSWITGMEYVQMGVIVLLALIDYFSIAFSLSRYFFLTASFTSFISIISHSNIHMYLWLSSPNKRGIHVTQGGWKITPPVVWTTANLSIPKSIHMSLINFSTIYLHFSISFEFYYITHIYYYYYYYYWILLYFYFPRWVSRQINYKSIILYFVFKYFNLR